MIKIKTLYSVVLINTALILLYLCFCLINTPTFSVYSTQHKPEDRRIHLIFVGDIMLDRGILSNIEKYGFDSVFDGAKSFLSNSDFVIANLEGTVTKHDSISVKNNKILRFTFKPEYVRRLKDVNINIVSLANNHSLDFGLLGYKQTKDFLASSSIEFFGSARNDDNIILQKRIKNKNICFIGYHDLFVQNPEIINAKISAVRNTCYKIIVFTHWGNEYWNGISNRQRELGRQFIDSGADIVVGSHPHVVEPFEMYKNGAIFYSLGNFIFDQNLSYYTEHGIALSVIFDDKKTSFKITPTEIINREVKISTSTDVYFISNQQ